MDYSQLPILLFAAFGLGLLHALDADHIMAVTNLSVGRPVAKTVTLFCLRWALGHGLTLFIVGAVVFIAGISLPATLSHYAELLVAAILVLLGVYVLYDVLRRRIHIHFHQHDDLPEHAHWHSHAGQNNHTHKHTALFVGMLHGLAGSAPLLALIPLTVSRQPIYGFIYLLIFSLGVIVSMLLFGGLFGYLSRHILHYSEQLFRYVRMVLGLGAMTIGTIMLIGNLT